MKRNCLSKLPKAPFWVIIIMFVIQVFLVYVLGNLYKRLSASQAELKILQSTHVHTWIMDESCSKQLLNSDTLRLKLK